MYEIWSVGHKPYENLTNPKVESLPRRNLSTIAILSLIRTQTFLSLYTTCDQLWRKKKLEQQRRGRPGNEAKLH